MRVRTKMLLVALTAGVLLAAFASTALAHECFIVSRSETGNVAAGSNSRVWFHVGTVEEALAEVNTFISAVDPTLTSLNDTQLAWAVAAARAAGFPEQTTIFVGNHTLLQRLPEFQQAKTSDGSGIDHYFDLLVPIWREAMTM